MIRSLLEFGDLSLGNKLVAFMRALVWKFDFFFCPGASLELQGLYLRRKLPKLLKDAKRCMKGFPGTTAASRKEISYKTEEYF